MRFVLLTAYLWFAPLAFATGEGVILLYHRVSDSGAGSTRVTPERFAEHLDALEQGGYHIVPLMTLLGGVYHGEPLPAKAVAITFDDAFVSVGEVAFPMLEARRMPFSIFVATDRSDEGAGAFLTWRDMRALAGSGLVTFGAHSLSHAHLESLAAGGGRDRQHEIFDSVSRVTEELGTAAIPVFAYPYGEYSCETEALLRRRELYGLAQQSGALGPDTPTTRIPRFPMYVGGDSLSRLTTAIGAKPLYAADETHPRVFYGQGTAPPKTWGFKPQAVGANLSAIQCFSASGDPIPQRWRGDMLQLELPPFRPGRNKVNCTAPSQRGGFHWYSRLWLLADAPGEWLKP